MIPGDADWLPDIPDVTLELLETHAAAHGDLDRAVQSAHPAVRRLWTRFAIRLTVAAIANVSPPLKGSPAPLIFPPPRAFLGTTDLRRLAGARAGFRHVDSRLAMVRQGYQAPPVLLPETPYVLHALVEGPVENPIETNPGMIRGKEFGKEGLPASGRPIPTHDRCRPLMEEALRMAGATGLPAVTRAGWLLFTLGEIHPFQDGNGRVVRLLYLLVTGEEMPQTADWGVLEQLRFHEQRLVDEAKTADPGPTVALATELSIAGAYLMSQRLAVLGAIVPELAHRLGLPLDASLLAIAVWLRRIAPVGDLADDMARPYAEVLGSARTLEAMGLLRRYLGPRPEQSSMPAFTPAPGLEAEITSLQMAALGMA